jgi:uncharacterized membrane protein
VERDYWEGEISCEIVSEIRGGKSEGDAQGSMIAMASLIEYVVLPVLSVIAVYFAAEAVECILKKRDKRKKADRS